MLSKRIQVLIEKEEYNRLKQIGKKTHKSLGELFREAVRLYGQRLVSRVQRLSIVEKMTRLSADVTDWPRIEKNIIKARLG